MLRTWPGPPSRKKRGKGGATNLITYESVGQPPRVVRGAVTTDVYNAAGQGVRFENGTGRFVGFLEASKATR